MKKKICAILIAVLIAVLGASTYFIIEHYKEANTGLLQAHRKEQTGEAVS